MTAKPPTKNIYQIKITLRHARPPVTRRIQVKADTKLGKLHGILQIVMGWTNSHLHAFRKGQIQYCEPNDGYDFDVVDERKVRLDSIVGEGGTLVYEYDFGDGWEHDLKIEKIIPAETKTRYPRCLTGKRNCPPEDCGGPFGYQNLLEILRDPTHEEHAEMREWLGGEFDPEAFDLDEVNAGLRHIK